MRFARFRNIAAALLAVAAAQVPAGAAKGLDPAFLAMTDCPENPGCAAIVLSEELALNNEGPRSKYSYRRIMKLFTQEGVNRYGSVSEEATLGGLSISDFEGKTILPDGTESPIRGDHIQAKIVRQGKILRKIKSVTMPGVVPGAIIDYAYGINTEAHSLLTFLTWEPQKEVPVLKSSFSLRGGDLKWGLRKFGAGDVTIRTEFPYKGLEVHTAVNVPPIPDEPFGPPPYALQTRLFFGLPEVQERWLASSAGKMSGWAGKFIQAAPGVAAKVMEVAPVTDPQGERLRKIYQFVQEKIEDEEARASRGGSEAAADPNHAGDVLARGYGTELQRTLAFLAMAREAGFEHALLLIAGRRTSRLSEDLVDEDQFDSFAAAVKVGAIWGFYDPGTRHCPYGMVAAEKESGSAYSVLKLVPNRSDGEYRDVTIQNRISTSMHNPTVFQIAAIPFSQANRNTLTREARVTLEADGAATVSVVDIGTGLVDLDHRELYERLEPEKRMERLAQAVRQNNNRAELTGATFEAIDSFQKNATLRYQLRLPGFASKAGDRLLLTPSLFHAEERNPLTAERRRTDVHLPHTVKTVETIRIAPPEGWEVEDLPAPAVLRDPPLLFTFACAMEDRTLVLTRRTEIGNAVWTPAEYPRLRTFLGALQEADRLPIALRKAATP